LLQEVLVVVDHGVERIVNREQVRQGVSGKGHIEHPDCSGLVVGRKPFLQVGLRLLSFKLDLLDISFFGADELLLAGHGSFQAGQLCQLFQELRIYDLEFGQQVLFLPPRYHGFFLLESEALLQLIDGDALAFDFLLNGLFFSLPVCGRQAQGKTQQDKGYDRGMKA